MVTAALRVGKQRRVHTAEGEQPAALQMIKEWLSFSLLSLSAIFFVVDPMGAIPVFLAMTRNDPPQKRRDMALRASITAFFVLTTFAVAGTLCFSGCWGTHRAVQGGRRGPPLSTPLPKPRPPP